MPLERLLCVELVIVGAFCHQRQLCARIEFESPNVQKRDANSAVSVSYARRRVPSGGRCVLPPRAVVEDIARGVVALGRVRPVVDLGRVPTQPVRGDERAA